MLTQINLHCACYFKITIMWNLEFLTNNLLAKQVTMSSNNAHSLKSDGGRDIKIELVPIWSFVDN